MRVCLDRDTNNDDELRFGVAQRVLFARRKPPLKGAQWSGLVTGTAVEMLRSGAVDAVVCVQSDPHDR